MTEVNKVSEKVKIEMPKFDLPRPDRKCKKCFGTGRLGYNYDPKNKEYDKNGDRKLGKPIPCPNYQKIIEEASKKYIDSLTDEQQYELMRKDGDPETLAEAKAIQESHDAEIELKNENKEIKLPE